jgi:hypothetical protein
MEFRSRHSPLHPELAEEDDNLAEEEKGEEEDVRRSCTFVKI